MNKKQSKALRKEAARLTSRHDEGPRNIGGTVKWAEGTQRRIYQDLKKEAKK